MILVFVLYAVLALTFPVAQYATRYADPFFIVASRMIMAGILLLGAQRFYYQQPLTMKKKDCWLFIKTGIFHIFLAFVPEFWALQYLSALKVNVMFSATPFITAFFEMYLLKKRFTRYQIAGMGIGTAGALFLTVTTATKHCNTATCLYPFLPEIMLMIAIACAAYAWFVINELRARGYDLLFINGTAMLTGGFMSAITVPFFGNTSNLVSNWQVFWATTLVLIVISNVLVYQLYGTLLRYYQPTFLSLAGFLCPLFGAVYATLFFGECLTWHYMVAFVIIFIGLFLFWLQAPPLKKTSYQKRY
jgi:drug/metabolite transporter (DMT)-like permease